MIIGAAAGFLFGIFSTRINYDGIVSIIKSNMTVIAYTVIAVFALENIIFFILSLIKYKSAKKTAVLAKDDEDLYEEVENKINSCILISNVAAVVQFVLFSIAMWIIVFADIDISIKKVILFTSLPLFLFGLFSTLFIQRSAVNLAKKINPEKRGNVFDFKFDKTWEKSCDEGELRFMYEAGYRAYMFTAKFCYVILFLALMSMVVFRTGIFPIICIESIHLALFLSNYHAIKKQKKHK
jgi:hypothetical protein